MFHAELSGHRAHPEAGPIPVSIPMCDLAGLIHFGQEGQSFNNLHGCESESAPLVVTGGGAPGAAAFVAGKSGEGWSSTKLMRMGRDGVTANHAKYANRDSRSHGARFKESYGASQLSRARITPPWKLFLVIFIFFQIMQTMQSDVDVGGAFVRGWAHGKEKFNWFLVDG
jgi:hypothetical protein